MRRSALAAGGILFLSCSRAPECPPPPAPQRVEIDLDQGQVSAISVKADHVDLLFQGEIIRIRNVKGLLIPALADEGPVLDNPDTYAVVVNLAEVGMDLRSLERILRKPGKTGKVPLRDADVSISGDRVVIAGQIKPGGIFRPMSFRLEARPFATEDGQLGIQAEEMSLIGIDVDETLAKFNVELEDLIRLDDQKGLSLAGNTLMIDVLSMVEKPQIKAFLADVQVLPDGFALVLTDGEKEPYEVQLTSVAGVYDPGDASRVVLQGGIMRFGDVKLLTTYIEIEDQDPADPLVFDLATVKPQMRAAYNKMLDQGLRMMMPDAGEYEESDIMMRELASAEPKPAARAEDGTGEVAQGQPQ